VRELGIDVVHTFFHAADLWAGPIAKLSGAKVLVSSRRDMGFLRSRFDRIGYRLLRNFFDQIQTVSEGVKRYTIENDGVDSTRVLTVYNGIEDHVDLRPAELESLRQVLRPEPDTPVITCVANLRRVKGIDVLIRAAALVRETVPNARFVVAGSFGVRENLKYSQDMVALSKQLGLEHAICFLDQVDTVSELLHLSDIFVLPSRTEGLSNALLEAMRSGLPCVATAVGGNPEVVGDGVTGFIVPSQDPEAIAGSVIELLNNPAMRCAMGSAGRERVRRHFSSRAMAEKVRSAYDGLLQRRNVGG